MKIDELRRKMIKPEAQPISSFDMTNQQKQFLEELLHVIDPRLDYHQGRQEIHLSI